MSESLASLIDRLRPGVHTPCVTVIPPKNPERHVPAPVKRETAWDMIAAGRQFCAEDPAGHLSLVAPLSDATVDTDSAYLKLSGRYVKAGEPNVNGAFWTTEDLWFGLPSVTGGPVNYLHDERLILGAIMASSVVSAREQAANSVPAVQWTTPTTGTMNTANLTYPVSTTTTMTLLPETREISQQSGDHVAVEMVLWKWLNMPLVQQVERAAKDGQLWASMECVSESVTCMTDKSAGRMGCGRTFAYGDPNPCSHIQRRESVRHYQNPTFLGGAVIVPPVRPGWPGAVLETAKHDKPDEHDVAFGKLLRDATIHPRTVLGA